MSDPFSLVYTGLWDLAEDSAYLTSLVKLKNRIRFDYPGQSSPIKDTVSNADLPELALIATAGNVNMQATSSSSMATRNYQWIISTGDMSISNKLLPVEWALFCAMIDWKTTLTALQWNGQGFVKRVAITDVTNGESDSERNRGIKGWSAIWGIEVEMHFATRDLQAVNVAGTGT